MPADQPNKSFEITDQRGLSLIEITITIAIFVMVTLMAGDYIINAFGALQFGSEQADAIASAQKAMEIVKKTIREARSSERGDYALLSATPQSFTFFADSNNDLRAEKVMFYLASSTLWRAVTAPGVGSDYPGPAATSSIARFINNQTEPVFLYYDDTGTSTAIINQIRLVNIRLKVNVTPLVAPADYYVETDVNLRNLKDNL